MANESFRVSGRSWVRKPLSLGLAGLATLTLGLVGSGGPAVAGPARAGTPEAVRAGAPSPDPNAVPDPHTGLLPNGRLLDPAGHQTTLGRFPTGGAITSDGKFLWTVSTGLTNNDVRIVDTAHHRVCQVMNVPGASGGIALDSKKHLAYVSGLPNSRFQPSRAALPGVAGDVVYVFKWKSKCGHARLTRLISVPPQPNPPTTQSFPPPREGLAATGLAWPQKLAVSPNGKTLLVPLNLADSAAIVDLNSSDRVRYVLTGSYPFGASIAEKSKIGVVTNEAAGTLSVIDLSKGVKLADIAVGPPLSHPQGVVIDKAGKRAYVALSASDQVVVVDLKKRKVARTIFVGRSQGLGTMPVALAFAPNQDRLFVANSGSNEIAVIRIPGSTTKSKDRWDVVGRIPTADMPQAVATVKAKGKTAERLMYVTAKGRGVTPNPTGPVPTLPSDPIFWAFNPIAPTTDVFQGVAYLPNLVRGRAGIMTIPSDKKISKMTSSANKALKPTNAQKAPVDTVLRSDGPIKHVFFVVRENRTYDQILGDDVRGNGDPKLSLFGPTVTPNMHALVTRFPLLDNVFANSEASIQGHYLTASASIPDYVTRNWVHQYAGRGRPNDFGSYSVTWPGNGYIFNQAEKQKISYFNYGEAFMGGFDSVPDRDRTPEIAAKIAAVQAHSDLGPPFGGCFPGDMSIGTALDNKQIFDSSLPAKAAAGSYSHVDCFRQRFAAQLATGTVPALNYLTFTSDHTRGTEPGYPTPTSMVADSDLGIGQLVETISKSAIWSSSAIFIVEDDSQDGADHVNAHRIPVAVISPYARAGAVIHNRYDLLSVVRSVELLIGMEPLSINDALATPMYDAFSPTIGDTAPYTALVPEVDLLAQNSVDSPDSQWSTSLALEAPDQVSQAKLDVILWHSVKGADSTPPPPGPGAEGED